jgi:hypothetical protein
MATPHVAGTAALYLAGHATAKPGEVAAAVTGDATPNVVSNPGPSSPNLLDYIGPGAPALSVTAGNATVHLSWTAASDGGSPLTGYKVYRGTTSGGESATPIATPGAATTTYDDNTVQNFTTYYYQVSAVNAVGETRSAERLATPFVLTTFHPLTPARVLDTRWGTGAPAAKVGPGQTLNLTVAGQGGVPSGASAVVVNVTVTNPDASSFVTVFPADQSRPVASNLNFVPGETVPNLVVVGVPGGGPTAGKISLYNYAGNTDLVADVVGYYGTGGAKYAGLTPARVLDTRWGTGAPATKVGPGQTLNLTVAGQGGVPASGVKAVVVNVTVTNPDASSFVTVFPGGQPLPGASTLNFVPGETVPNLVVVGVDTSGQISLYNAYGHTDLIADVVGYYQ